MKTLLDQDGLILYQDHYTDLTLEELIKDIEWRNDSITMFGKTYPQPRLTAWYGEEGLPYTYSKIKMIAKEWTPLLRSLKLKLEHDLNTPFNSVLVNYYRDGNDHMSYHADDEKELGENPVIASLSFGVTRKFHLKHRKNKKQPPVVFELENQSLIVMKGELQKYWNHKISKSTKIKEPRLNLTFRQIYQ